MGSGSKVSRRWDWCWPSAGARARAADRKGRQDTQLIGGNIGDAGSRGTAGTTAMAPPPVANNTAGATAMTPVVTTTAGSDRHRAAAAGRCER